MKWAQDNMRLLMTTYMLVTDMYHLQLSDQSGLQDLAWHQSRALMKRRI